MRFFTRCLAIVRPLSTAFALIALTVGCTTPTAPVAERSSDSAASERSDTLEKVVDNETPGRVDDAPNAAPSGPDAADAPAALSSDGPSLIAAQPTAAEVRPAAGPVVREAAKPVVGDPAAGVPEVFLSAGHSKLCKVNVGDVIPTIELPKLDGGNATLESLAGPKATVVVFWTADRWMSATALEDLGRLEPPEGVAIVGIAVNVKADAAPGVVEKTGAEFPQLVDADGTAFAQVGEAALPRIYVLDGQRRVAWFDIEYSEATRRELEQTLAVLASAP